MTTASPILINTNTNTKEIVISDIHLFHRRCPTAHIITNLYKYLLTADNQDADIIYIAGDLFDREGVIGSPEFLEALDFIRNLLEYCEVNDIMLRVLDGTPSHDWSQSRILIKLNKYRKRPADLKFFDVLDIEYNARLEHYVLYIPDEWGFSNEEIEAQIDERMKELGITQVDTAILHRQFQYQVAHIPDFKPVAYREEYFLDKVKGWIHIGHHHNRTQYQRISGQGAFDRHKQGEDDPKGYVIIEQGKLRFVENKDAYIFTTVKITEKDNIKTLGRILDRFPKQSYVRLNMDRNHPLNIIFQEVRLTYPDYHLDRITETSEKDSLAHILSEQEFKLSDFLSIASNIGDTLRTRLEANYTFTPEEQLRVESKLALFIGSEVTEEELND